MAQVHSIIEHSDAFSSWDKAQENTKNIHVFQYPGLMIKPIEITQEIIEDCNLEDIITKGKYVCVKFRFNTIEVKGKNNINKNFNVIYGPQWLLEEGGKKISKARFKDFFVSGNDDSEIFCFSENGINKKIEKNSILLGDNEYAIHNLKFFLFFDEKLNKNFVNFYLDFIRLTAPNIEITRKTKRKLFFGNTLSEPVMVTTACGTKIPSE